MKTMLALFLICCFPQEDDARIKELVAGVRDYPTKFKVISLGRQAVPHLMAQLSSNEPWLVFETKSTLRWIANRSIHNPTAKDLERDLESYCIKKQPALVRTFAAELMGDVVKEVPGEALIRLLRHEDEVALSAVDALQRIGSRAAGNALEKEFPNVSSNVKNRMYTAFVAHSGWGEQILNKAVQIGEVGAMRAIAKSGTQLGGWEVLAQHYKNGVEAAFACLLSWCKDDGLLALEVFKIAKTDADRRRAIEAIADSWVKEMYAEKALAFLYDTRKTPAFREASDRAILSIADRANQEDAAKNYRALLKDTKDPTVILRCLAGCGRTNDTRSVELIVPHLESNITAIQTTAVTALRDIPSEEAGQLLTELCEDAEPLSLLHLVIDSLGKRGDPAATKVLQGWVKSGEAKIKNAALTSLVQIADQSNAEKARTIYHYAIEAGATRAALNGLTRTGDARSLSIIADYLKTAQGELRDAALHTLLKIGDRFATEKNMPDATMAYQTALELGPIVESRLRSAGVQVESIARQGRVHLWWVVGPFAAADISDWETAHFPEKEIDLTKSYRIGARDVKWKSIVGRERDGFVNLDPIFSPNEGVVIYAYAEIIVNKERDAVLKMGSDDGIQVWLNGKEVHRQFIGRGFRPDTDVVKVQLKQGKNTVLLKVCELVGAWGFQFRMETDKGRPLKFKIR